MIVHLSIYPIALPPQSFRYHDCTFIDIYYSTTTTIMIVHLSIYPVALPPQS